MRDVRSDSDGMQAYNLTEKHNQEGVFTTYI